MKKVFILFIFLVTGCQVDNTPTAYEEMVLELGQVTEQTVQNDVVITAEVSLFTTEENQYTVIIDGASHVLTSVMALAMSTESNSIHPSIGVVDEKITLVPLGEEGKKGILLTGYVPSEVQMFVVKVMVQYEDEFGEKKVYFIREFDNLRK